MFGVFLKRLLFVVFLVCEAPFVYSFFAFNFSIRALVIVLIIFIIYLALNWIFSAFVPSDY